MKNNKEPAYIVPKEFFDNTNIVPEQGICFVLSPFGKPFDDIYDLIIKKTIENDLKMKCFRADSIFDPKPIMTHILEMIQKAEIIIADLTGKNPNVFYELGIVHTVKDNTIIMTQNPDDIPFDLKHLRFLQYENTYTGAEKLRTSLIKAICFMLGYPLQWKGTDVNEKTDDGITALMRAARKGNIDIVRALLDQGAIIDLKDRDGWTALMYAIKGRNTEIVELLIKNGADVDTRDHILMTALMRAAYGGHEEIVELLLSYEVDVNAKDKNDDTALMLAAQGDHIGIIKILYAHSADVNAKAEDGMTALMFAAEKGHMDTVQILLNKGADVNMETKDGETAIAKADKRAHTRIIKILKEHSVKK